MALLLEQLPKCWLSTAGRCQEAWDTPTAQVGPAG